MEVSSPNRVWKTKLIYKGETPLAGLENICEDIAQKDDTFQYNVQDDEIIITSKDKDQAHQRGMWFKRQVSPKIKYKVYWEHQVMEDEQGD